VVEAGGGGGADTNDVFTGDAGREALNLPSPLGRLALGGPTFSVNSQRAFTRLPGPAPILKEQAGGGHSNRRHSAEGAGRTIHLPGPTATPDPPLGSWSRQDSK